MEIIHIQFDTLSSTNVFAKENIAFFSQRDLTIVSASMQTAGKGQFGRYWLSPIGNIYATYCLFTTEEKDPLFWTRLMAETLHALLLKWGIYATLKWPNDILVDGRKIVGILTETVPFKEQIGVCIGVGFNVNLTKEQAALVDQPATSLFIETEHLFDEKEIFNSMTEAFYRSCLNFI